MLSSKSSRHRHSKQSSSSKKKAPPPDLALASRHSSSSNNSDAQATPRSIFYSSLRPSKRPSKEPKPIAREEPVTRKAIEGPHKGKLDVFAFMEKDDEHWDTPAIEAEKEPEPEPSDDEISPTISPSKIQSPQASPRYSDLEVKAIQHDVQRAWGRASLHSDSGISMHSSSPEQDSPIMQHKYPMIREDPTDALSTTPEDDEPEPAELRDSPEFLPTTNGPPIHDHWPSLEANEGLVPEACSVSPPPNPFQFPSYAPPPFAAHEPSFSHLELPASSQRRNSQFAPQLQRRSRRGSHNPSPLPSPKKAGYDLLASNISSHPHTLGHSRSPSHDGGEFLRPIYRKFETLNNRMLLYLQDEISEIEEQLSELDAAIAHEEGPMGQKAGNYEGIAGARAASRRHEAKLPSQLQWHRMDLLHRSFGKVELYNKALTSYTTLIRTLDPASTTEITKYKSWIESHTPIVPSESAFLENRDDLVAISPSPSIPKFSSTRNRALSTTSTDCTDGTGMMRLDSPFIVLAFAFTATIIVFKVVPRFLARLVISMMVGLASLCLLTPGGVAEGLGSWKGIKQRRGEIARVAFVMFVLAVVVD